MSSLPAEHVVPTPEEIEFALLVQEHGGSVMAASKQMWPNLKHPQQRGYALKKKPAYDVAVRAIKERTKHEVRAILEAHGAGQEERLAAVAAVIKGQGQPSCGERLKYIEYADDREGRVEEKHDGGGPNNFLEAIVLGAVRVCTDGSGAGLRGVCGDVSSHPDQEPWPTAVQAVADAEGQG